METGGPAPRFKPLVAVLDVITALHHFVKSQASQGSRCGGDGGWIIFIDHKFHLHQPKIKRYCQRPFSRLPATGWHIT